ncbi:unnamed protein product, partial [Closterium sp. Naga37s-1]
ECLDTVPGIDLPAVYAFIEKHTSKAARTAAWKERSHWITDPKRDAAKAEARRQREAWRRAEARAAERKRSKRAAKRKRGEGEEEGDESEEESEEEEEDDEEDEVDEEDWVGAAEKVLAHTRPIAETSKGVIAPVGASGYLEQLLRDCEDTMIGDGDDEKKMKQARRRVRVRVKRQQQKQKQQEQELAKEGGGDGKQGTAGKPAQGTGKAAGESKAGKDKEEERESKRPRVVLVVSTDSSGSSDSEGVEMIRTSSSSGMEVEGEEMEEGEVREDQVVLGSDSQESDDVIVVGETRGKTDREVEKGAVRGPGLVGRAGRKEGAKEEEEEEECLVRCTVCGQETPAKRSRVHSTLSVPLCRTCHVSRINVTFSVDKSDGTEQQCHWCGLGGHLLLCDTPKCRFTFCRSCVLRNFGAAEYRRIEISDAEGGSPWKCYCCDAGPLAGLQAEGAKVVARRGVRAARGVWGKKEKEGQGEGEKGAGLEGVGEEKARGEGGEGGEREAEGTNAERWRACTVYVAEVHSQHGAGWLPQGATKGLGDGCGGRAVHVAELHSQHGARAERGSRVRLDWLVLPDDVSPTPPSAPSPPSWLPIPSLPSQVEGVRFMWQNCIHSKALVQSGDPGFGCILAHSMGLGKTLQVITFVHTVLNQFHSHGLRTVLIVAPVNVLHNWKEEFRRWMPVVGSGAAARGGGAGGAGGGVGGVGKGGDALCVLCCTCQGVTHPFILTMRRQEADEAEPDTDAATLEPHFCSPLTPTPSCLASLTPPSSPQSWWQEEEEAIRQGGLGVSGKLTIALDILRQAAAAGDKVLFFSQSLLTLDLLELLLADMHDPVASAAGGGAAGVGAKWTAGVHWYRIDGSVSAARRQTIVNRFNEPRSNRQARCVLISTRAGSVGINLVAANRVVLLDGSWNPAHDLQAMFRVWRYGQNKKVFVYRLLAAGTMEEKIYNRQVVKEGLAARVVDEQQVVRHFTDRDLDGLFSLDDEPSHAPHPNGPHAEKHAEQQQEGGRKQGGVQQQKGEKEGGPGAKHKQGGGIEGGKEGEIADAIMRKILADHKDRWIVRWHEHEPLLREVEHHLSKEEKETAMKSYSLRLLRSIAMAVPAHLHALPPLPHPSALASPSRTSRALGAPQCTLPLRRRVHDFLSGEPARRTGSIHGEWDGSAQRGFREGGRRAGGRESIIAAIGGSSGGTAAPSRGQGSGVPQANHMSSSSDSDSDTSPARQSPSLSSSASSSAPASASSANSASARHRLRGLRADDIRHPLDRQNTALLRAIPGLNDLGRVLLGPVQEQILVLENLGSGVLVSPQQLPSLHALMEEAAVALDMPSPPDLYVRQSPVPNAYTLAINGQKPFVVVHTALLDLLSPLEVQAVLAHELGHLKCEHGLWLTFANLLALGAASSLPGFLGTMLARGLEDQLLRWLRAAELTCDRAALVVVRDPRVVVSVLMKLAGGSTSGGGSGWGVGRAGGGPGGNDWGWAGMGVARAGSSAGAAGVGGNEGGGSRGSWWAEELSVDAFLAQARSYDEAANSGPLAWYLRNAQTRQLAHPLPVLRAREVDRWARSPEFKVLMGRGNVPSAGMVGAAKGAGAGGGKTAGSSAEASGNGMSAPTARLAAPPSASAASDASSAGATPLLPLRSGSSGRPLSRQSAAFSAPTPGEFAQPSSASARGRRGAVLVRAESVEAKGAREETQPGVAASAYSDSEGEDASAPRLTVAQKLQLQMSSPTSLPDGTTIPLPIGGRRRVLSASYPLAAWTPAQKRNLARATLLNKVGERNDSPLFATIGALVLGPPVVILAVAFFSGYVDFLG